MSVQLPCQLNKSAITPLNNIIAPKSEVQGMETE